MVLVLLTVPANAVAAIRIKKIAFDPSGSDLGSSSSLRREYIVLKNTGNRAKRLKGWKIKDQGADHTYKFGRFKLRAGRSVTIHTGRGADTRFDRYWDLDNYVWNNDGDKARLLSRGGKTADSCSYSGGSSPNSPKRC